MWRGAVKRAIQGKRGQAFLAEMLAALDALPQKRLIEERLIEGGEVCAIGSVGLKRGLDMSGLDVENHDQLAKAFGIAPALVQEIEFINDDDFRCSSQESPEQRFARVRAWVARHLAGSFDG